MNTSIFGFDPDTRNNAVLNWWFRDREHDDKGRATELTKAWDFINLGKAYLGNSLINITMIIDFRNKFDIADKMIFPIIFTFWQGIELLLKAGIFLTQRILNISNPYPKKTHNNSQLLNEFISRLKKIKFDVDELKCLKGLLDDFNNQSNKLDPTFMRYTIDDKGLDHFYVKRNDNKNICIKISEFSEMMAASTDEIVSIINFLALPFFEDSEYLQNGGRMDKDAFLEYKKNAESASEFLKEHERPLFEASKLKGVATMFDAVWRDLL